MEITRRTRNLGSRIAFDDDRIGLHPLKQGVGKQRLDVASKGLQPLFALFFQRAFGERQQIGRDASLLHAQDDQPSIALPGKGGSVFERRTRVRGEVGREEDIAERIHTIQRASGGRCERVDPIHAFTHRPSIHQVRGNDESFPDDQTVCAAGVASLFERSLAKPGKRRQTTGRKEIRASANQAPTEKAKATVPKLSIV